jgi:hypothetical protein
LVARDLFARRFAETRRIRWSRGCGRDDACAVVDALTAIDAACFALDASSITTRGELVAGNVHAGPFENDGKDERAIFDEGELPTRNDAVEVAVDRFASLGRDPKTRDDHHGGAFARIARCEDERSNLTVGLTVLGEGGRIEVLLVDATLHRARIVADHHDDVLHFFARSAVVADVDGHLRWFHAGLARNQQDADGEHREHEATLGETMTRALSHG